MQLKKFAEMLGVSRATVSLAMNNSPLVAEATKKRIQEAARRFGYFPSPQGRALRRGRSELLGCILPNLNNSFFATIFCGISRKCTETGYALLSMHVEKATDSALPVRRMLEHGVEGIIFLASPKGDEWHKLLKQRNIPAILYDAPVTPGFPVVMSDDLSGGKMAMEHLLARGHRHILCSARRPARLQGNRYAAQAYPDARIVTFDAADSVPELLGKHPEITAVTAYSDDEAIEIMRILKKTGRRVPEDISLIGFDNMPYSAWEEFGLTTVSQAQYHTGTVLCEELLRRIAGQQPFPECISLPLELIERQTVRTL